MRYQPLALVAVVASAGIAADRWLSLPPGVWGAVACAAWLAWGFFWRQARHTAAGLAILLSVAACGGTWHHLRWEMFNDDDLGHYAQTVGEPACVEAVVVRGPRRLPAPEFDPMRIIPAIDQTELVLRLTGIRDRAEWQPVSGLVRVTVEGHLLGVFAGDRVQVFGRLSQPRPAMNPGAFDGAAMGRAERRLCRLRSSYPDCVRVVGRSGACSMETVRRSIDRVRTHGEWLLWRYLDEDQARLAAAILLGSREEIDRQQRDAFRETGTSHLFAISGLHVGIVAWILYAVLGLTGIRRSRVVFIVAAVVVFYTVLSGARPPAIRAMILVLVFCLSKFLGRRPLGQNSLAAAGLVVLALNPADLFRTGVQLSFLAVATLMWVMPQWIGWTRHQCNIGQLLMENRPWPFRTARAVGLFILGTTIASGAIWFTTLPLVMARFHLFPPIALFLNTLVWVPMIVALASGFGLLFLGWLVPPLAPLLGSSCDRALWLLDRIVASGQAVPYGHFWVPGPPEWWLAGFYGGLFVLAALPRVRPPRRWCWALLAAWIAVGFVSPALRQSHKQERLECTFLSVGHGCATLVRLPSGQTLLYDAGHVGSPYWGAHSIAECLWAQGHTHLDAVVLSHSDADHYNLLPELTQLVSVGVVYVSPVMFEDEGPALLALQQAIREARIPLREIHSGNRLQGGKGCQIEVLHPTHRGELGRDNTNSLVLAIEYLGNRLLLPGDLESAGLEAVLAEEPWDCHVLLAPHHGSRGSDPPGLAKWCHPEWVVISGGISSFEGSAAATYREGGAIVLHTGEVGAVRVEFGREGIEVSTTLPNH